MNKTKKSYQQAFLGYLWKTLSESKGLLGLPVVQKIFLLALNDYFAETINVKTLSSVATSLYFDFNKPSNFDVSPIFGRLGKLLEKTSNLEWIYKNKSKEEVENIVIELKKYHQENTQIFK